MSEKQRNLVWIGVIVAAAAIVGGSIAWNARAGDVSGDTPGQRVSSILKVAGEDKAGAADSLARAVTDPNADVRRAAIVCLSRYRRPEDRPLVETALEDETPAVRQAAAKALVVAYDDQEVIDQLAQMLADDDEVNARIGAMMLGKSRQAAAVVPLVRALDAPPSPHAAALAMEALDRRYKIGLDLANVDDETWAEYIEVMKHTDEVRGAYEAAGLPLNRNMEIVQRMIDEHSVGCHSVGAGDKPISGSSHEHEGSSHEHEETP